MYSLLLLYNIFSCTFYLLLYLFLYFFLSLLETEEDEKSKRFFLLNKRKLKINNLSKIF
jgi:hypothetical protein